MLEEAVRWVILIIIFVFDPLAVLLLIASQYTFEFARKRKDDGGERLRREYEQLRAQKIVDNPGFNVDDTTPPEEDKEDWQEEITGSDLEDIKEIQKEYDMTPMTEEEEYANAGVSKEEAQEEPVEKKDI